MDKVMNWLEGAKAPDVLISLLNHGKMYFSELRDAVGGNISTINKRIEELKQAGLINEESEASSEGVKKFGGKRYIWLTNIGEKVAKKLDEIKSIIEEKEKLKK